ncbi:MAG: sialidase family protein [Armatimonadota bacterium]
MKLAVLMAGCAALGAPSIDFQTAKLTIPEPHRLRVELAATGSGVEVGSYGVRTREADGDSLPGLRTRGDHMWLPAADLDDRNWYLFLDNERGDLDPADGRVAMEIDVSEWPDGEHWFTVFACNRPATGSYVHDARTLRIQTEGGWVSEEGTVILESLSVTIENFTAEPERVQAGEPVSVSLDFAERGVGDPIWTITVPYWIEAHETPPGWQYDPEAQKASLTGGAFADNTPPDSDPADGKLRVELTTDGWRPGVHNFTLQAASGFAPAQALAYRDFAVTILPDEPRFTVEFEHDQHLREGTHFSNMISPAEGEAIAYNRITRDGGFTWGTLEGRSIPSPNLLADGTVMGMPPRSKPIEGRPGYFTIPLHISTDSGRTVTETVDAELHVPDATSGVGHAFAPGPIFFRSIVQMPDGSLLATFYGWFEGDESPVPGQKDSFRYRTWLMRSEDGGRHWEYHATVAYDPEIGTEGYCEPVMKLLPDGTLICLLRTGGDNRPYHLDNPLMVAWSEDGGLTWTEPIRTGFEGVAPDLVVMEDGTLACSTGRPGAWLLLSNDNGRTWSDAFSINAERYSGYTGACEVEPGVLLIGYGAMNWLNPETGERENSLRTVRAKVRRVR